LLRFNAALHTLSILTASAVPVLEALRIAGDVVTNLPMREAVAGGSPSGRGADRALAGASRLFLPMTITIGSGSQWRAGIHARQGGQNQGGLEGMLTAMVGLLGPMMIVGMGLFVLMIVFAMLLPIFQMNSLIR
jgi:general secretion pathway protein F